ncbi:hypothetical protein Tco_1475818 [Tanacetum coccineum]
MVDDEVSKHIVGSIRIDQQRLRMGKEIGGMEEYSDLMEKNYREDHDCHPRVGDRDIRERSCVGPLIMEYLVKLSKRRAFWSLNEDILKIMDSDTQYAVSIKEDTAYPCLHSPKTTKGMKINTPYPDLLNTPYRSYSM